MWDTSVWIPPSQYLPIIRLIQYLVVIKTWFLFGLPHLHTIPLGGMESRGNPGYLSMRRRPSPEIRLKVTQYRQVLTAVVHEDLVNSVQESCPAALIGLLSKIEIPSGVYFW